MAKLIIISAVLATIIAVGVYLIHKRSKQTAQHLTEVKECVVTVSVVDADTFEKDILAGMDESVKGDEKRRREVQKMLRESIDNRKSILEKCYATATREKERLTLKLAEDLQEIKTFLTVQDEAFSHAIFNQKVMKDIIDEIDYDCSTGEPMRFIRLDFLGDYSLLEKKKVKVERRKKATTLKARVKSKTSKADSLGCSSENDNEETYTNLKVLDLMIFSNSSIVERDELFTEANHLMAMTARDAIAVVDAMASVRHYEGEQERLKKFFEQHQIELDAFIG